MVIGLAVMRMQWIRWNDWGRVSLCFCNFCCYCCRLCCCFGGIDSIEVRFRIASRSSCVCSWVRSGDWCSFKDISFAISQCLLEEWLSTGSDCCGCCGYGSTKKKVSAHQATHLRVLHWYTRQLNCRHRYLLASVILNGKCEKDVRWKSSETDDWVQSDRNMLAGRGCKEYSYYLWIEV